MVIVGAELEPRFYTGDGRSEAGVQRCPHDFCTQKTYRYLALEFEI